MNSRFGSILESAPAKAFLKMSRADGEEYSRELLFEQLKCLLTWQESRKSAAPGEVPLFDFLLKENSGTYRRTRLKAAALGAKLNRRRTRRENHYVTWEPNRHQFPFTPLEKTLARILEGGGDTGAKWKRFEKWRNGSVSVYHDLNHFILFKKIRPSFKGGTKDDRRDLLRVYFALIESLVQIRDSQLADELGKHGAAFRHARVTNYALENGARPFNVLLSRSRFSGTMMYLALQHLGKGQREIETRLTASGFESPVHGYFPRFDEQTKTIERQWFSRKLRNASPDELLPKPAAAYFEISVRPERLWPTTLPLTQTELSSLYSRFKIIFGA